MKGAIKSVALTWIIFSLLYFAGIGLALSKMEALSIAAVMGGLLLYLYAYVKKGNQKHVFMCAGSCILTLYFVFTAVRFSLYGLFFAIIFFVYSWLIAEKIEFTQGLAPGKREAIFFIFLTALAAGPIAVFIIFN